MRGEDKLDGLLSKHFRRGAETSADQPAAARVLAELAKSLPPQRQSWLHWPAALLRWDFAPAWPRIAALASCAVIGFLVGATIPSLQGADASQSAARGNFQLAAVLSEPEAMTGVLP